jgi:hypothetical protein
MNVDPRFGLAVEGRGGGQELLFRATRDIEADGPSITLAETGLAELLELADAPRAAA